MCRSLHVARRVLLPAFFCLNAPTFAVSIYHVQAGAVGSDGTTWNRAFYDLQQALDVAQPGDEIWVAAGTYAPTLQAIPGFPRSANGSLASGGGALVDAGAPTFANCRFVGNRVGIRGGGMANRDAAIQISCNFALAFGCTRSCILSSTLAVL